MILLFGLGLVEFAFIAGAVLLLAPAVYLIEYKRFGWGGTCMLGSIVLAALFFWPHITTLMATVGWGLGIAVLVGSYVVLGVGTAYVYWIFYNWRAREKYQAAVDATSYGPVSPGIDSRGLDAAELDAYKTNRVKYSVLCSHVKTIFEDYCDDLNLKISKINSDGFYRAVVEKTPLNEVNNVVDEKEEQELNRNLTRVQQLAYEKANELWVEQKAIADAQKLTASPADSKDHVLKITAEYQAEVERFLPPRFSLCKRFIVWAALDWPITLIWLLTSRVVKQLIERLLSWQRATFDMIARASFGKV